MTFDYKSSVFDEGSEVELKAEVVYADDEAPENNTATASVKLQSSAKPGPASASAEATADGVDVTWTAPEAKSQ